MWNVYIETGKHLKPEKKNLSFFKSVQYPINTNRNDLSQFIEFNDFEVYAFGHSFEKSDFTILREIFTHRHCIKIKVFYHPENKDTDFSSKSQLLRMISKRILTSGSIDIPSQITTVYLDQTYSIVNPDETILENMKRYNPKASNMSIRAKLREFLFWDEYQVNQLASNISGGQVARLAFAMISLQQIEIVLLDEPTNNLDFSTQEAIIAGLNAYTGTIITVSHSLDFLKRIHIDDVYCITQKSLIRHPLHIQEESFYPQLLELIGDKIV
jgi:ABC-type lipoprotein export system ATPase subunit